MSRAAPMDHTRRLHLYRRGGRHMTGPQRRRFWHKLRRQVGGPREYYGTVPEDFDPGSVVPRG